MNRVRGPFGFATCRSRRNTSATLIQLSIPSSTDCSTRISRKLHTKPFPGDPQSTPINFSYIEFSQTAVSWQFNNKKSQFLSKCLFYGQNLSKCCFFRRKFINILVIRSKFVTIFGFLEGMYQFIDSFVTSPHQMLPINCFNQLTSIKLIICMLKSCFWRNLSTILAT